MLSCKMHCSSLLKSCEVDTSRDGSVQVSAAVELERSGTSIQSIEEEMKSDVTKKVRNMVASGIQNGYVFAPGEYTVQDPTCMSILQSSSVYLYVD